MGGIDTGIVLCNTVVSGIGNSVSQRLWLSSLWWFVWALYALSNLYESPSMQHVGTVQNAVHTASCLQTVPTLAIDKLGLRP